MEIQWVVLFCSELSCPISTANLFSCEKLLSLRLLFGILGAFLGGAGIVRGGMRVVIGGWIALGKFELAYGALIRLLMNVC